MLLLLKMKKGLLNLNIYESVSLLREISGKYFYRKDFFDLFFKTKGLEFEGYKEYSPYEDDAINIDWKASSRSNKTLVRQFKQEKEMKIFFLIDSGSNMVFGSQKKLKCEIGAEIIGAMATLLIESDNLISYLFFSDRIKSYFDFKKGNSSLNLFYETLKDGNNYGGKSNFNIALDFAIDYLDRDTTSIFIVSDFLSLNESLLTKMSFLAKKFDTIAIRIIDPLDITLPDISGEFIVESNNSGKQLLVNPKLAKRSYEFYALQKKQKIEEFFRRTGINYVDVNTSENFIIPLAVFLKERFYSTL
jgi:uncharacterized protein (DUF58 family)